VALVVLEDAIFVEGVLGQGKVEDPDVIASDIGCMLACSCTRCKLGKKLHTCNEM
jgi:hypothetical protein